MTFPEVMLEDKVRGKPERCADHFTQARLFWRSQTAVEQDHIVAAYRFELTRVQTSAVRERVVALPANVDADLAQRVGERLGPVAVDAGASLQVEITFETAPSVLWDAVVLPAGGNAQVLLADQPEVVEFVQQQWTTKRWRG